MRSEIISDEGDPDDPEEWGEIDERFDRFYIDGESEHENPTAECIRRCLNTLAADKMDREAKMFRIAEHLRMVPAEFRADAKKRLEALFA